MSEPRTIPRATFGWLAAGIVAVCFGAGFALAYEPAPTVEVAGPTVSSTTVPTASSTPPTTSIGTTTAPLATTSTVTSTTLATTTAPVTTASTLPTPSTLPPTPAVIEATYPRDLTGTMTLVEGGVAAVILHNSGGLPGTFVVEGSGLVTVGATGTASGTIQGGEILSVPLIAGTGAAAVPSPQATIRVFAGGALLVTIPVDIS